MNNPIAVNRYTLTKGLIYESMKRISRENYDKFAKKVVLAVVGLWLLMGILTMVLKQDDLFLLLASVITLLVVIWVAVYLPWDKRRRAWKNIEKQYGSDLGRKIVFAPESLTVETAEQELSVLYSEVEKVLESEHLYIILTENGKAVLVDKNGFKKGRWEKIEALQDKMK